MSILLNLIFFFSIKDGISIYATLKLFWVILIVSLVHIPFNSESSRKPPKDVFKDWTSLENRIDLYNKTIKFLPTRVELDFASFKEDIWSH